MCESDDLIEEYKVIPTGINDQIIESELDEIDFTVDIKIDVEAGRKKKNIVKIKQNKGKYKANNQIDM